MKKKKDKAAKSKPTKSKLKLPKLKKKTVKRLWIGSAIAAVAGAAAVGIARSGWQPFANGRKTGGTGAGEVDEELNQEVADAIQPSPSTEDKFMDEGSTGNND